MGSGTRGPTSDPWVLGAWIKGVLRAHPARGRDPRAVSETVRVPRPGCHRVEERSGQHPALSPGGGCTGFLVPRAST